MSGAGGWGLIRKEEFKVFGKKLTGCACLAALIALGSTGCGAVVKNGHAVLVGAVYTRVKFPLTTDLSHTPAAVDTGGGKIVRIKEPFSGYGIYAEFNSNAIGEIAKRHGLKTVYYADIERLSILGIWRHDEIIVCGEK
jgi:predicted enzyme related to lactoylglutathione lyase